MTKNSSLICPLITPGTLGAVYVRVFIRYFCLYCNLWQTILNLNFGLGIMRFGGSRPFILKLIQKWKLMYNFRGHFKTCWVFRVRQQVYFLPRDTPSWIQTFKIELDHAQKWLQIHCLYCEPLSKRGISLYKREDWNAFTNQRPARRSSVYNIQINLKKSVVKSVLPFAL